MDSQTAKYSKDYSEAVATLMSQLPRARQAQIYEFVLFLSGRAEVEETPELIEADERLWDAQFANTSESKLDKLIAGVEDDIAAGRTKSMFDAKGMFMDQ